MLFLKRIVLPACAVLGVVALAFWFFLWRGSVTVPESSAYPADLQRLRALAEGPGLPRALRSIKVAEGHFPGYVAIAGGVPGVDRFPIDWRVFLVEYEDRTIMIDPVHDRQLHVAFPFAGDFDDAAYDRMQEYLKTADMVLATHEHWDHVGGVARSPHAEAIRSRVRFTEEQITSSLMREAGFPEGYLESLEPLRYDRYLRVAPGLVVFDAAGHTPGSQMIFLKLEDGREILFVGDVVWNEANLDHLRGHSRFIGMMGGEDLKAQAHQIRWLADLRASGQVTLIVGHDRDQHAELLRRGIFDEL